MTGLLVSVRDRSEAQAACAGGADLIDVKEPTRGSLGAADAAVWREVAAAVAGRKPMSVALGELADDFRVPTADELAGCQFVKLGLARGRRWQDWPSRWQQALEQLPATVARVAVVYVDWRTAESPPPESVIEHAARLDCRAVLFDTFAKGCGSLLDHLPLAELAQWCDRLRRDDRRVVLGGSLNADTIREVLPLQPDYVAVRGAVCRGDRCGAIDTALVRCLAELLGEARA